jgi:hypothetical protein
MTRKCLSHDKRRGKRGSQSHDSATRGSTAAYLRCGCRCGRLQFPSSFALHSRLGVVIGANHNQASGSSQFWKAIDIPATAVTTELEFVAGIYILSHEVGRCDSACNI